MDGIAYRTETRTRASTRYLYFMGVEWHGDYNWLDNDWNDQNPAALRANLFNFSRDVISREFCFESRLNLRNK